MVEAPETAAAASPAEAPTPGDQPPSRGRLASLLERTATKRTDVERDPDVFGRGRYGIVPADIYDGALSIAAGWLFGLLCSCANAESLINPKHFTIKGTALRMRCSRQAIQNHLRELEVVGRICRVAGGWIKVIRDPAKTERVKAMNSDIIARRKLKFGGHGQRGAAARHCTQGGKETEGGPNPFGLRGQTHLAQTIESTDSSAPPCLSKGGGVRSLKGNVRESSSSARERVGEAVADSEPGAGVVAFAGRPTPASTNTEPSAEHPRPQPPPVVPKGTLTGPGMMVSPSAPPPVPGAPTEEAPKAPLTGKTSRERPPASTPAERVAYLEAVAKQVAGPDGNQAA